MKGDQTTFIFPSCWKCENIYWAKKYLTAVDRTFLSQYLRLLNIFVGRCCIFVKKILISRFFLQKEQIFLMQTAASLLYCRFITSGYCKMGGGVRNREKMSSVFAWMGNTHDAPYSILILSFLKSISQILLLPNPKFLCVWNVSRISVDYRVSRSPLLHRDAKVQSMGQK